MSIRFSCPGCGASINANDDMNSWLTQCPQCQTELFVPDPTEMSVPTDGGLIGEEAPVTFGATSPTRSDAVRCQTLASVNTSRNGRGPGKSCLVKESFANRMAG